MHCYAIDRLDLFYPPSPGRQDVERALSSNPPGARAGVQNHHTPQINTEYLRMGTSKSRSFS
jgi:hypothetical protein